MKKNWVKRSFTLLEIMIVIFLITLITGAVAYNMRGSLDRGKAFRTERAKEQLEDLLILSLAENPGKGEEIAKSPLPYLKQINLSKNPDALLKDGWGEPFQILYNQKNGGFKAESQNLARYSSRKKGQLQRQSGASQDGSDFDQDEDGA